MFISLFPFAFFLYIYLSLSLSFCLKANHSLSQTHPTPTQAWASIEAMKRIVIKGENYFIAPFSATLNDAATSDVMPQ
jgi:hypothetical protein